MAFLTVLKLLERNFESIKKGCNKIEADIEKRQLTTEYSGIPNIRS